jgi:exo-1,4-beta-D-glucosaminidase
MDEYRRELAEGWRIRAAGEVDVPGDNISLPGFDTQDWVAAAVPCTVLAALVAAGKYKDPYFGMNLRQIPREPFEQPWWYWTEFRLSEVQAGKTVLLECDGVNYAANIWLNGRQMAKAEEMKGAFRRFQYDVSRVVESGRNVLAVEVVPPKPGDFTIGFVDWNPPAPDRDMGIFRPVRLRFCDGASIENPFVQTRLNLDTLGEANLTICADMANHTDQDFMGTLEGRIEELHFAQDVHVQAHETRTVTFTAEEYPALRIANPRVWWPHDLATSQALEIGPMQATHTGGSVKAEGLGAGEWANHRQAALDAATRNSTVRDVFHDSGGPELYPLELKLIAGSQVSDVASVRFGIREVADYWTPEGHRGFKVNGRQVLIKGAGWTDDLLLADTRETIDAELRYVRHMNLNCIRCENIWGRDQTLYDLCDEYGILVMVGWSCQWEHEQYLGKPVDERYGGVVSPEDIELVSRSWQDQLLWLRHHPSIFVWAVASDKTCAPDLEKRYIEIFRKYDPTRPYLASTGGVGSEQAIVTRERIVSDISGCSGVKMLGPYEYTPPVYWYTDTRRGGAYGFNTETSPGAVVPTLESLKRMLPPEHLWPIDEYWHFHCGLNEFTTLDQYRNALTKRYGEAKTVEEFARKAQVLNYELMRPMFEAFRVHRGRATGVIQWMLNAAWPKMWWQLYDWYLMPTGAFYGAKKACQPMQLIYNYGDRGIYLVNEPHALVGWQRQAELAALADGVSHPQEPSASRRLPLPPTVLDIDGGGTARDAGLTAEIRVYDIESRLFFAEYIPVQSAVPVETQHLASLPRFEHITTTYFLSLRLLDAAGSQIADNFYWLSTKPDVLDYSAKVTPWEYYTPSKGYADLTLLDSLPPAEVEVTHRLETIGEENRITVELANRSDKIAFFIELLLTDPAGNEPIVPIFWQDNYVTLLPSETKTLTGTFPSAEQPPVLTIRGWNVGGARPKPLAFVALGQ